MPAHHGDIYIAIKYVFTRIDVSSFLECEMQLRMVLIMSWSFGLCVVKSTTQAYQRCPPYCCTVVPTKPSTLGSQLCFHSMRTHPQAQQHKRSLCFAFSLHSPQTGMFERQAAVVGRGPSTAAGLLSQRSRNSARGLIPMPSGSLEFRRTTGSTRQAIKNDYRPTAL